MYSKNLKVKILLISSIVILISGLLMSCSNNKGNSTASLDSINYLSGGDGDWVIKIDDLSINQNNFEKDLTASMQYQGANEEQIALAKNDNATKQYYSEVLIRDVLLLKKAEEDKFFESEEAKSIINAAVRTLKAQYYLQRLILEASKNIPDPTPEQARAFFEQAKDQISQMYGITEYNTQTMPTINQLYKVAYSEQLVQRDITDLKDKAIIERNNSVLGEASMISPLQQGAQTNLLPRGN